MYACQYGRQALKFYNFTPLLVSLVFLPSVCVKSRNKDLNLANSHLFHVKIPAECAEQTWLNKNLSNTPKRPVVEWRKHGSICVFLPPKDLTECMDVHANPGPPKPQTDSSNLVNLQLQRPHNEDCSHLSPLQLARFIADKNYLLFVPKSIMTRNSGLVSGDLMQTGF